MNPRTLVYGDIDLNVLDGSAIWLQSVTQALARAGCEVTLLLNAPITTSRLIAPLLAEPRVIVRSPHKELLADGAVGRLPPAVAAGVLSRLDKASQPGFDLLVIRGRQVAAALAGDPACQDRLWVALAGIAEHPGELAAIAATARYLLGHSEQQCLLLADSVPAAAAKCVPLPPILSDLPVPDRPRTAGKPLRLVYIGNFAPQWNALEMARLPGLLRAKGVAAELHMVGDKLAADSGFQERMRAVLATTDGLTWHGGQPHDDAMRLAASCDIGLSWRQTDSVVSRELAMKVLEFGALGLPVILNRTPPHESLLGVDYPLFAATLDDVVLAARAAAANPAAYELAAGRTRAAAAGFTMDRAVQRLRGYLDRAFPARRAASAGSAGP